MQRPSGSLPAGYPHTCSTLQQLPKRVRGRGGGMGDGPDRVIPVPYCYLLTIHCIQQARLWCRHIHTWHGAPSEYSWCASCLPSVKNARLFHGVGTSLLEIHSPRCGSRATSYRPPYKRLLCPRGIIPPISRWFFQ